MSHSLVHITTAQENTQFSFLTGKLFNNEQSLVYYKCLRILLLFLEVTKQMIFFIGLSPFLLF